MHRRTEELTIRPSISLEGSGMENGVQEPELPEKEQEEASEVGSAGRGRTEKELGGANQRG